VIALLLGIAQALPHAKDDWQIERRTERCAATRPFGGKFPGTMTILSSTSTDFDAVINIEFADAPAEWAARPFTLALTPRNRLGGQFGVVSMAPAGGVKFGMPLNKAETADLTGSTAVSLEIADAPPIVVNTGALAPTMKALRECGDEIWRGWSIDPARMVPSPPGGAAAWFRGDDYPEEAKRTGAQGRTMFVASVLPNGSVATCKIVASSGSEPLDAKTCEIVLLRGHYGAAGVKGPRWAIGVVRWTL
jgi:hypothetical protein